MAEFGADLCGSRCDMNYWVKMAMPNKDANWVSYGVDGHGKHISNPPTDINAAHYTAQHFNEISLKAQKALLDSPQAKTKYWVEEYP